MAVEQTPAQEMLTPSMMGANYPRAWAEIVTVLADLRNRTGLVAEPLFGYVNGANLNCIVRQPNVEGLSPHGLMVIPLAHIH